MITGEKKKLYLREQKIIKKVTFLRVDRTFGKTKQKPQFVESNCKPYSTIQFRVSPKIINEENEKCIS